MRRSLTVGHLGLDAIGIVPFLPARRRPVVAQRANDAGVYNLLSRLPGDGAV